jgi:hypothetical protein
MTTERKRPSGGDGRVDFRCLGNGKSSKDYNQSCPACGIPTQSDHLPRLQGMVQSLRQRAVGYSGHKGARRLHPHHAKALRLVRRSHER